MRTVLLFFILGITDLAFSFYLEFPLNPDEVRWTGKTCAYELKATPQHKLKWKNYDLQNPDNLTKCFVRCVLEYAGIYDLTTKTVSKEALSKQFKSRGLGEPKNLELLNGATDGKCAGVYAKLKPFLIANMENYKKAFYADKDRVDANKWYADNHGKVKDFGQKASVYCGEKYSSNACSRVNCAYQYYRLVDGASNIITVRHWNAYNINRVNLKECQKEAAKINPPANEKCKIAKALKNCMKKKNKEEWGEFEKFLDEVSATNEYPATSA